jgi:predicted ribosomally synthesized peptide with SipW-like signal peptide
MLEMSHLADTTNTSRVPVRRLLREKTMSDKEFSLSRRKALAGLGSIGAAAALGGIGTYAQFSDTEESSFTFTAGGVDGTIDFSASYNGDDVSSGSSAVVPNTSEKIVSENEAGLGLSFNDMKPGDYGSILFELTVENNPAWVASCVGVASDTDGEVYEPELEAEQSAETGSVPNADVGNMAETDGELTENTWIIPFYDSDFSSTFFDSDGPDLSGYKSEGATSSAFWSNSEGTYAASPPRTDGYLQPRTIADVVSSPGSVHTRQWNGNSGISDQIDAPDGASVGNGCVMLDGGLTAGQDSSDNSRYVQPLQPGDTMYFGYDWHIPFETGNVVQGDSMEVHLPFKFLQTRHTSTPEFGTYSPGDNTPS